MPTPNAPRSTDTSFGFESLLEAQTRLWNHLLDANRSILSLYTPWLANGAWTLNGALASEDPAELGTEPAATADGIPDPFELQTRSWNRLLDAQRGFWTSFGWPVNAAAWPLVEPEAADGKANGADTAPTRTPRAPAKKPRARSSGSTRAR